MAWLACARPAIASSRRSGERAVGLVGDEVRREEDRADDRGGGDRVREAQQRRREHERRRRTEDERQPAADPGVQVIRPRPDDERQPQREQPLAPDEQPDDD
jgi:hypothetical protein